MPSPEAVAAAAGVSRSTYFRVVGSHRDLLREAGFEEAQSTDVRILDAAIELLGESGISGLEMDQIAERAGVSRATLYRYFSSKAEIMAILARTRSPLRGLAELLMQARDRPPGEVLPALLLAATPRLMASRGLLRAILAEAAIDGPDGEAPRAVMSDAYAALAGYFEGQMDAGRLRRTDPLAAVQSLIGPVLLFAVARPDFWDQTVADHPPPAQILGELVQIWLRGMEPVALPLTAP